MHSHQIEAMLLALGPVLKNRRRARSILRRYWQNQIAIVWSVEDIHRAANELKTALTHSEAKTVLSYLLQNHDAQYGINWDSLTGAIEKNGIGRKLTKRELKGFIEEDRITIQK